MKVINSRPYFAFVSILIRQMIWYMKGIKHHLCISHCCVLNVGVWDQVGWREEGVGSPYFTLEFFYVIILYLQLSRNQLVSLHICLELLLR